MKPQTPSQNSDAELLADFQELWTVAEAIWTQHEDKPAFQGYVSADYQSVYNSLASLRGSVLSVLEWGAGLGVVTIMASRMGFEAYGIEAEAALVSHAERLAETFGPDAKFAQGSFIPDDFVWNPGEGEEVNRTIIDVASGYAELDMELRDFDLVYAYPWPEEHTLYRNIMQACGRPGSLLLTYDVREGHGIDPGELTRGN